MDFLRIYVWLALFDLIFAIVLWFRGGGKRDKWWSLILLNLSFIMVACAVIYIDVWNNGAKIIGGDCSLFESGSCFCNSPGEADMDCFVYGSKNTLNVIITRLVLAILTTGLVLTNLFGAAYYAKNDMPYIIIALYLVYAIIMFIIIQVYWRYTRVLRTGELSFGGVEPPIDLAFVSVLVFLLPWYFIADNFVRAIWFIVGFSSFVIAYARYVPAYSTMWIIMGFLMTLVVLFDKTFHRIQISTRKMNSIKIIGGGTRVMTSKKPVTKVNIKRQPTQKRQVTKFIKVVTDNKSV